MALVGVLSACSTSEPAKSTDAEGSASAAGDDVGATSTKEPGVSGRWDIVIEPTQAPDPPVAPEGADEVRAYVIDALGIMEQYGLYAEGERWEQARAEALAATEGLTNNSFVHLRLREATDVAGGRHTALLLPTQVDQAESRFAAIAGLPTSKQLPHGVAYLSLVSSGDGGGDVSYENTALRAFTNLDSSCGWVLDLRDHGGGSALDSLGAAAPLISPGPNMAFRERNGDEEVFSFEPGRMVYPELGVYHYPAELHQGAGIPLAILISEDTASAGEAVVVALLGQEDTRFFGQPTSGVPTGNEPHFLADGAKLILTEVFMVDRTGTPHDSPIKPDTPVDPSADENVTLNKATAWLRDQC